MPELVDTDARQAVVSPVVCRIVSAEGISAASVRRVAQEARAIDVLRRWRSTTPEPSRIILPEDVVEATPDRLEPDALHLLALASGLTALVRDQAVPLSVETVEAWLGAWNPERWLPN